MSASHDKLLTEIRKRAVHLDKRTQQQTLEKAQLQDTLRALKQVTQLSESELAELASQAISQHYQRKMRLHRWLLITLLFTIIGVGGYSVYHYAPALPTATRPVIPSSTQPPPAQAIREPPPDTHIAPSAVPLRQRQATAGKAPPRYKKAAKTWGAYLNPSHEIPSEGFKAFYLNTNNPEKTIATELVGEIAINYAYNEFHGIPSQDFGAYWVGMLNVAQTENREISIDQGWSNARLIIDGNIVYEAASKNRLTYLFTQGSHLVEVEYTNNWHTTEFLVELGNTGSVLRTHEINRLLERFDDAEVYFAGLYESASQDMSVNLDLDKREKPIILFLSSYRAVKWMIRNPFQTEIKAIVYGSYHPGSRIMEDVPSGAQILPYASSIGSYTLHPQCTCRAGHFHCENESGGLVSTLQALKPFTRQTLSGMTAKYAASSIRMPETYLTVEKMREVNSKLAESAQQKISCAKQAHPDFEEMFQNKN